MIPERVNLLLAIAPSLEPWVGFYNRATLMEWLRLELGDPGALDGWVPNGSILSRAVPLSPVLHVVSGNTPHAAFQSVFRGLLLGCRNRVKLPSAGLPEFEAWVKTLPAGLSDLVEVRHELPDEWLRSEAAVIFGGADTIAAFRKLLAPEVPRIEHGPKSSIAVIFEPSRNTAGKAAADILRHDQRGCLSVQAVFVNAPVAEIHRFGDELAAALECYRKANPRPSPGLSDSGAVSNAREIIRFREANGDDVKLWESIGSTAWTVVYQNDPRLAPGPLNGYVTLHPLPRDLDLLGPETAHLSTVAIDPFTAEYADRLAAPRICALGAAQDPTLFWSHDGMKPLATLVRWRDLG